MKDNIKRETSKQFVPSSTAQFSSISDPSCSFVRSLSALIAAFKIFINNKSCLDRSRPGPVQPQEPNREGKEKKRREGCLEDRSGVVVVIVI